MTSKIHIKAGNFEIDFEGEETFIKQGLLKTVEEISQLFKEKKIIGSSSQENGVKLPQNNIAGNIIEGTVNTIADKLNVKSGSDLIIAAAAHLDFVNGRQEFSRKDILSDIQTASNYYKDSYSPNLSVYLKNLGRSQKLNEIRPETYALQAKERARLKELLSS